MAWLVVIGLVTGVGVCLVMITIAPKGLVALVALGAGCGAALHPQAVRWSPSGGRSPLRRRDCAAALAAGAPALAGWIAALGPLWAAVVIGVLLAGGVPLCGAFLRLSSWRERRGPRPPVDTPPVSLGPAGPVDVDSARLDLIVASWSDRELWWAWRLSFTRLQRGGGTAATLAGIAHERRVYLDEIERRDPRGFAAWISAAPRGGTTPAAT